MKGKEFERVLSNHRKVPVLVLSSLSLRHGRPAAVHGQSDSAPRAAPQDFAPAGPSPVGCPGFGPDWLKISSFLRTC